MINIIQDSRALYTFVLNKSFDQSLQIPPKKNNIFLNIFKAVLFYEVWFTYQDYKHFQRGEKINVTLVIN